jgi:pyruvate/2-oxoglutarate dehydrogenase complex dihydrolipoamide dehydrogenase (E3) component
MAQAHRRLGAAVTLIEGGRILGRDDHELADLLRRCLEGEGIVIQENCRVIGVASGPLGVRLQLEGGNGRTTLDGSTLLVAAGRKPAIDGLGLAAAGIDANDRGIVVDARLRTTNRRVFAIGDTAGGAQFTHVASYHAGVVIKNALFRIPARAAGRAVPHVTYSDPELASVGDTEEQARASGEIRILRWSLAENDRARAEGKADGLVKVVTDRKGRVLGAHLLGSQAGELILPWVFAVEGRLTLAALAAVIAPYPTLSEASKRAAGTYFVAKILTERTRRLVRFLLRLP